MKFVNEFYPIYSFHDSAFVKESVNFGNEDQFIGEKSDRVKRINFNDVRIIVMKTAVKIERMDAVEY